MIQLYIGNKNYSSWSMRPWVLLRQAGIAFDVVRVRELPGVKAWIDEALAEKDFLDFEEPYRLRR